MYDSRPASDNGEITITIYNIGKSHEGIECNVDTVQGESATFGFILFAASLAATSCESTYILASMTGNVDGTIYTPNGEWILYLYAPELGANLTSVTLNIAKTSHTADLVYITFIWH